MAWDDPQLLAIKAIRKHMSGPAAGSSTPDDGGVESVVWLATQAFILDLLTASAHYLPSLLSCTTTTSQHPRVLVPLAIHGAARSHPRFDLLCQ
jgi:hypothetical protein